MKHTHDDDDDDDEASCASTSFSHPPLAWWLHTWRDTQQLPTFIPIIAWFWTHSCQIRFPFANKMGISFSLEMQLCHYKYPLNRNKQTNPLPATSVFPLPVGPLIQCQHHPSSIVKLTVWYACLKPCAVMSILTIIIPSKPFKLWKTILHVH